MVTCGGLLWRKVQWIRRLVPTGSGTPRVSVREALGKKKNQEATNCEGCLVDGAFIMSLGVRI